MVDRNDVAKVKALDAVFAFVENVPGAAQTVGEVVSGLLDTCVNGQAKIKEKAIEIIMMYVEADKQQIVQNELIKRLEDSEQPEIVRSCLQILRRCINEFSTKTMPIEPIIKFIPKLLENNIVRDDIVRDDIVRDEAKKLLVEMCRWSGAAAIIWQLEQQQVESTLLGELGEMFKKVNGQKPQQSRFLRSHTDFKAKLNAGQMTMNEKEADDKLG